MRRAQVHRVVAKRDLAAGTLRAGAQDLDWGACRKAAFPPQRRPAQPSLKYVSGDEYIHEGTVKLDFNGAIVRRAYCMPAMPVPAPLMKSGEGGFMSAVLNPGMRAVSIAVNATSGNAGFISPGDHVDLIVTHRVKPQNGNNSQAKIPVVSETFVHDVRVLAVDQQLDNPDNKAILAKTVTVEVTPHQAEQVAVAADMGKISIALRSLAAARLTPKPASTD